MERGTVMEINYKDIGVRVKQERINKNITQEKLAELSGVSVTHMSNIENANTKLSLFKKVLLFSELKQLYIMKVL